MAALGALRLPVSPRLDGIGEAALTRIREQARVQDHARREDRHIHELVTPVEPDKGLAALPEPSDGDVFCDLEGDVFAAAGALEYLFGVADRDGNYNPSWALDSASERRVFERFIDDVMARWEQHPGFHIYHYGAYETTAVKRLISRYATREDEVDRLMRGRVFVDLYRVVRQGLRVSVESYSIKQLEPFYGFARAVDLATATRAIIQVEAQLESGYAAGIPDSLRTEIEGYNRDDGLSTLRLAACLEGRRRELQALTGQPVPRPTTRNATGSRNRRSRLRRCSRRSPPGCRSTTTSWTTSSGHGGCWRTCWSSTGARTSPCGRRRGAAPGVERGQSVPVVGPRAEERQNLHGGAGRLGLHVHRLARPERIRHVLPGPLRGLLHDLDLHQAGYRASADGPFLDMALYDRFQRLEDIRDLPPR